MCDSIMIVMTATVKMATMHINNTEVQYWSSHLHKKDALQYGKGRKYWLQDRRQQQSRCLHPPASFHQLLSSNLISRGWEGTTQQQQACTNNEHIYNV